MEELSKLKEWQGKGPGPRISFVSSRNKKSMQLKSERVTEEWREVT